MADTIPGVQYSYTVNDSSEPPYEPEPPYVEPDVNGNLPSYVDIKYLNDNFDTSNLLFENPIHWYLLNDEKEFTVSVPTVNYYTVQGHSIWGYDSEKPDPGISTQGEQLDYPIGKFLLYTVSSDILPPTEDELDNLIYTYYAFNNFRNNLNSSNSLFYINTYTTISYFSYNYIIENLHDTDINYYTEVEINVLYEPYSSFVDNLEPVDVNYLITSLITYLWFVNIDFGKIEEEWDIFSSAKVLSVTTDRAKKKRPVIIRW